MSFKEGDKVRVKTGLTLYESYDGGCVLVNSMREYEGQIFKIKEKIIYRDKERYNLKGAEDWYFSNSMLTKPKNNIRRVE